MTIKRINYRSIVSAITLGFIIICLLFLGGCAKNGQSKDDNTEPKAAETGTDNKQNEESGSEEVQMIETEGDVEITIPEDQESGGF